MKKFYVQLVLLCCFSIALQAQSKLGTYGLQVEAGYAFDTSKKSYPDFNHQAFNIAVSPGYHVTDKLIAGVGVALYDYRYSETFTANYGSGESVEMNSSFISVPIYAHGLWKFGRVGKPGLFVSLKAGYGIISKSMDPIVNRPSESENRINDYSGGLYLSPSVGYMYPINNKHALLLSVSYDHQDYTTKVTTNGKDYKNKETNMTIAVKAGWIF